MSDISATWRTAVNLEDHGGDGFVNTFVGTPEEAQTSYAEQLGAEYVSTEFFSSDTVVLNFKRPWADDSNREQAVVVTMVPAEDAFEDPMVTWMDDAMTQLLNIQDNIGLESVSKFLVNEHRDLDEADVEYFIRMGILAGIRIGKGELPPVLPEA